MSNASEQTVGILLATGVAGLTAACDGGCPWLLPMGDRTPLDRWVRRLAEAGCSRIHVIVADGATAVSGVIGDGGRWGVPATVHLVRDAERSPSVVSRIEPGKTNFLVGCGVEPSAGGWSRLAESAVDSVLTGPDGRPFAVAKLSADQLAELAEASPSGVVATLAEACDAVADDGAAEITDAKSFLEAAAGVLRRGEIETVPGEPGTVAVGRNVRIHPTARIVAPAAIAADCTLGAGSVVGPFATLGVGCVLDDGAEVREAVASAGTYVGAGLLVAGSVACGPLLTSGPRGTTVRVADRGLLDRVGRRSLRRRVGTAAVRVAAAAAWLVTRPLAVAPKLTRGPVRDARTHFLRRVVPRLGEVVRGRTRLVGQSGVGGGSDGWRPPARPEGLIDERTAVCGCPAGPVETAAADAYYAARASTRRDVRLLLRYAGRVVFG